MKFSDSFGKRMPNGTPACSLSNKPGRPCLDDASWGLQQQDILVLSEVQLRLSLLRLKYWTVLSQWLIRMLAPA
ncbi:hypothetical protein LB505_001570 [Fusarium chuoi]|nr:hypothetical protein LB505_001570 [Fusarium chuoi]